MGAFVNMGENKNHEQKIRRLLETQVLQTYCRYGSIRLCRLPQLRLFAHKVQLFSPDPYRQNRSNVSTVFFLGGIAFIFKHREKKKCTSCDSECTYQSQSMKYTPACLQIQLVCALSRCFPNDLAHAPHAFCICLQYFFSLPPYYTANTTPRSLALPLDINIFYNYPTTN